MCMPVFTKPFLKLELSRLTQVGSTLMVSQPVVVEERAELLPEKFSQLCQHVSPRFVMLSLSCPARVMKTISSKQHSPVDAQQDFQRLGSKLRSTLRVCSPQSAFSFLHPTRGAPAAAHVVFGLQQPWTQQPWTHHQKKIIQHPLRTR